ncbi:hypothetical protein [Paraburkholderia sp. C35]|uniref:hypothetical protein n=1 Tax=Paraburkholderia sp. C35 TaxID=2126993 RepID=UPI000D69EB89|nr:hypothetical protein [Paraburkholderia sp. C35]
MNRLTAAQARDIAGPTAEERLELRLGEALNAVREAAEKKKREIALRGDFWTHGGYGQTADWIAACNALRNLGYEVDFFYEERQFVNMYTIVRW